MLRFFLAVLFLLVSAPMLRAGTVGDFNGDGRSDLLWRNSTTGAVYMMPMSGGAVQAGAVVWTEPNPAWAIVGTADFDGDGKADILWWNSDTGQVCLMLMTGTTIKASNIIFTESNTAWKIAGIADFTGDGNPDLLWRNSLTGQVYMMPFLGTVSQPGGIIWTEPNLDWQIVAAADFSGEGKASILWRNSSTGQVYLMRSNGISPASGSLIYTEANLAWQIVGTGDFDGDDQVDMLWRNSGTGLVYVMPMKGGQPQAGAVVWTEANPAWQIVATGDFDGDGKDDILWWNATTGQVYLMTMNGTALKGSGLIYTEPNTAWRIQPSADQASGRLAFNLPGGVVLEMLTVPGGTFTMGSPVTEVDRSANEGPQHAVTLSRFYMGKFTVTQAQWVNLMGSNPSNHTGDLSRPVEQVNYFDVTQAGGFLDKLNAATSITRPSGMIFRLPTEAEWEYAARGGTSTRFYWGDDPGYFLIGSYAWWNGNAMGTTHGTAAGELKPANPFGLYNMTGNVWEWCQDWQGDYAGAAQTNPAGPDTGEYRTCRGGDYSNFGPQCRVGYRSGAGPDVKGVALGFRLVLGIPVGLSATPTGLTYSVPAALYSRGSVIAPNVPANGGGFITSYRVSPDLPAGLSLDPVTGVISGTPTALSPATSYVVTGSNSAGSTSAALTISVTVVLPVINAFGANPASIVAGQGVTLSWSVTGATSLSISPTVGTVLGSSIIAYPVANTTYVLTALNSNGSVTASVTVPVVPAVGAIYLLPGGIPLELLPIPGGSFIMGSPVTEVDRSANEGPQHLVTLSPFSIGKFTVTQAQWLALMGYNPSNHTGDLTRPVEQVSYLAIMNGGGFLDKLNAATAGQRPAGFVFRLPTEAEWEYAARGGTTTRFYWGDDPGYALLSNYAWWNGSAGWTTHGTAAAELKPANPFGLYNMAGNVWQWCQDWEGDYAGAAQTNPTGALSGIYRTCRGGDYSNYGSQTRVAYRSGAAPGIMGVALGFRVVLAEPRGITAVPTGLSYASNPAVYSQWVGITANVPTNGGGVITAYQIDKPLPFGLSLDPVTGVISGTPTVLSPATSYVVTGSNFAGSASVTLTISVAAVLPVISQFGASPASVAAGQAVTLSWSVSGATSLSISPTVGTVLGSSVVVYPLATTTYVLTAGNSNGSVTTFVTVQATPPTGALYLLPGAIPLEMLPIPGGSFIMGSPVTEVDRSTNEGPQHGVTLSPFSIGKFTVTQAQWLALMGSNPSSHTGDPTRPVEQVNYYDVTLAGGFLDKLNAATANTRPSGMVFRLPTEAEWEYAARGGTSTRFYWGDDPGYAQLSNCAWWNGNAQWNTWGNATGDLKPANPYGLYNMAGNVWEWCQDWQGDYPAAAQINPIGPATGVYRTCRGGDYSNYGSQLRVAYRSGATPDVKGVALGFRVVLAAPSGLSVSPSGLAYATNPAIYSKGVAIPANTPSNGGGSITSFQVSPALPAGLQLDGITGVITGTPSSASASSGYVVTGSNSAGSASATLVISVTEAGVLPPSGLAYSTNPCVYTVGVAIAPNIPTVGGGAVNAYSISPGLPSGLNMNPFTGVISGVPASYTPAATYFVLASNAIGSAMASLSIAVNDVPPSLTPIVTMATYVTAGKAGLVATTQDQGPGVNYIWAIWSGTITSGQGTRSITYTADASAGAQVTIQVRVMNSGGTRSGAAIGSIVAAPIADLTVQPTAPPGMTGLQASVTSQPGSTYLWTIVSGTSTGTITNGQGTNALVFSTSALVGTFQLSVIVQNQASDGATQLATITVAHGIWVATGNLVSGRSYHEATLLKNGNVLVTGGNIRFSTHAGPRQILNSAEQYDPIAGTWRGTGSMGIGRTWHSVSELQDGKVLVAGGTTPYLGGTVATATAEIWNPISGNWQSTGAMQSARSGHTATVLPNGKVLVTGGGSSTSEIYDPTTGTWSLSAGMVALPEGRAGGELLGIGHGSTTDEKFNNVIPPWLSVDDLMHSRILGSTNLIMKGMVPGVGAGSTSRERFDPDSIALTLFNPIGVSSPGESLTTFKDGRILRAGGTMLPPNLDWPISDASICYP